MIRATSPATQLLMCVLVLKTSHRPDGIFTCLRSLVLAGRRCLCPGWHGELLVVHHHWQHSYLCACSCSKLPIAPMGKMLTRLLRLSLCTTGNASVNYSMYVPQRPSKVPIAPMGFSHVLRLCLQGGGVAVWSGSVTFLSCTITGNSAQSVRAHAGNFPLPRWEKC